MKFDEILHKFRAESFTQRDKGMQFERLMRSWLLSDPRYSNLSDVWLWEDFPCRRDFGGSDTGIDLVARTDTGQYLTDFNRKKPLSGNGGIYLSIPWLYGYGVPVNNNHKEWINPFMGHSF